jgi:hypothetical protein
LRVISRRIVADISSLRTWHAMMEAEHCQEE